jgi:hypothetical protein
MGYVRYLGRRLLILVVRYVVGALVALPAIYLYETTQFKVLCVLLGLACTGSAWFLIGRYFKFEEWPDFTRVN